MEFCKCQPCENGYKSGCLLWQKSVSTVRWNEVDSFFGGIVNTLLLSDSVWMKYFWTTKKSASPCWNCLSLKPHHKDKSLCYISMYWTNLCQPTVHVQQNIFETFFIKIVTSSHLYASFGTFCVQIAAQWVFKKLKNNWTIWAQKVPKEA